MNAIRPAARDQIGAASFLIDKGRLELSDGHLVDWLRTLGRHGTSPCVGEYCHG
jgi:hypothetical protein